MIARAGKDNLMEAQRQALMTKPLTKNIVQTHQETQTPQKIPGTMKTTKKT